VRARERDDNGGSGVHVGLFITVLMVRRVSTGGIGGPPPPLLRAVPPQMKIPL